MTPPPRVRRDCQCPRARHHAAHDAAFEAGRADAIANILGTTTDDLLDAYWAGYDTGLAQIYKGA